MRLLDPELEELFASEPELAETARLLREARPEPVLDPRFRPVLRARLLARAAEQAGRGRGRDWWRRRTVLLGAGATTTLAMAAAAVIAITAGSHPHDRINVITASSPVSGQEAVATDEITVAFNAPMDRQAVVAGLRLEPATEVRTAWSGQRLLIEPVHHLAPNTPYRLTIDERSARASNGAVIRGGVRIAFGTAPAPAGPPGATQQPPPLLDLRPLGSVSAPSVLFAPDGSVVATHALVPAPAASSPAPVASPTPSAAASPTPSPAASPSPSPPPSSSSPSPSPSPAPPPTASPAPAPTPGTRTPSVSLAPLSPALAAYPPGGGAPRRLGDAASAAAYSPDGTHLAATVPAAGGADVVVSQPGSPGRVLTHSDTPGSSIAWSGASRVLYVSRGQIDAVDLDGTVHAVAPVPAGSVVTLAPGGHHAFLAAAPGGLSTGSLLDLSTGSRRDLRGSHGIAAFSPGGRYVARASGDRVGVAPVAHDQVTGLATATGGPITAVAVSDDGRRVAYVAGGNAAVAQLPSGSTLGTARGVASIVLSGGGDRAGLVISRGPGGEMAEVAHVPSPTRPPIPGVSTVPPAAELVLTRFLDAQVHGDLATVRSMAGAGSSVAGSTPRGLTRSRVVTVVSLNDGSVAALVELISDGSKDGPAYLSDEMVRVHRDTPGAYSVAGVDIGPRQPQPTGPHVIHIGAAQEAGTARVITFDSDIDAATLAPALSVTTADGRSIGVPVTYSPDSRTATLYIPAWAAGQDLDLSVDTHLTDIEGQHLQSLITVPLT